MSWAQLDIFFYRYRHPFGLALILFALINGCVRFNGDLGRFCTMVFVQLWFAQGLYCYFSRRRVAIAPGGLDKDADPAGRAALAAFALLIYTVIFFLDF